MQQTFCLIFTESWSLGSANIGCWMRASLWTLSSREKMGVSEKKLVTTDCTTFVVWRQMHRTQRKAIWLLLKRIHKLQKQSYKWNLREVDQISNLHPLSAPQQMAQTCAKAVLSFSLVACQHISHQTCAVKLSAILQCMGLNHEPANLETSMLSGGWCVGMTDLEVSVSSSVPVHHWSESCCLLLSVWDLLHHVLLPHVWGKWCWWRAIIRTDAGLDQLVTGSMGLECWHSNTLHCISQAHAINMRLDRRHMTVCEMSSSIWLMTFPGKCLPSASCCWNKKRVLFGENLLTKWGWRWSTSNRHQHKNWPVPQAREAHKGQDKRACCLLLCCIQN